jgi:thiamine biosynthesis lipoprotein
MAVAETSFQVMGSTAQVVTRGGAAGHLARAEQRLRRLEDLWTRFSPDSEVSRVNTSDGEWTEVSPETAALIQLSELSWRMTDGLFDPTGLPAVLAAGYSSSRSDPDRRTVGVQPRDVPTPGCMDFLVTDKGVRLPAGVSLDPGGIGKGLAADIVASELSSEGVESVVVSIGGDVRVIGGWIVDLEDPFQEGRTVARLNIANGGVATSTPSHRRWESEDGNSVHLIDPRTGKPALTDVESVTIIAGEAWIAEGVATAAALIGSERAPEFIDRLGLAGIVIDNVGRLRLSNRVVAFLL